MSDRNQRTEKPTPQKLRKAREKGQFPHSKELVAAIQFAVLVGILGSAASAWFESIGEGMRSMFAAAFTVELTTATVTSLARRSIVSGFVPLAFAGSLVLAVTLLVQLASTNMGVSFQRLAPNFSKFNPMSRLKEIPRQNLPVALQALIIFLVMAYFVYAILQEHLAQFLRLPFTDLDSGLSVVFASVQQLLWRMAALVGLFGAIEFIRHRWIYHGDLSMTKQEVREEHKQNEGDPHIKARIRRIRRDMLRRQMMREVPTATAVIVNPTHFAVAIRYDMETMASPVVVAKGRNYIAAKIRQLAIENGVTIVENPPLARALFDAVEIGREIPPDFYRAVAEVLAYVFRITGKRAR
jgi:flagellar biosynthetic protein FlhB